jgi:hypothetical protein
MQAFDMLREANHFGSSHVTVDISLTRGAGRQPLGRQVLCSFPTVLMKKGAVTPRGQSHLYFKKRGPASPLLQQPSFFSAILLLTYYLFV